MTFRCLAASLACLYASHAAAILIRADREDAEYLELATRYTSSVSLNAPDGEGVLVAARWVLTAAHMAKAMQELRPAPRLTIGGKSHEIQAYFIHPDWKRGGPADIALILLKEASGVEPARLYRDSDEAGKGMVTVGSGYTGKIGEKPSRDRWDRKKRAFINTVDRVTPRILGSRIKPPDEASDLQGATAPGDSGGPAYIENDEGIFVAGISYATDDSNADGIVGNPGDWELYTRVSAFVPWIEATMIGVARRELDRLLGEDDRG